MGSSLPLTGVYPHHPATLGTGAAPQPGKGTGLARYLSLEHLQPLLGVRAGRAGQGQHSLCSQWLPVYPASHRHCPLSALQLPSLLLQLQVWAQSGPQRPRSQAGKTQQEPVTGVYPRARRGHRVCQQSQRPSGTGTSTAAERPVALPAPGRQQRNQKDFREIPWQRHGMQMRMERWQHSLALLRPRREGDRARVPYLAGSGAPSSRAGSCTSRSPDGNVPRSHSCSSAGSRGRTSRVDTLPRETGRDCRWLLEPQTSAEPPDPTVFQQSHEHCHGSDTPSAGAEQDEGLSILPPFLLLQKLPPWRGD